MHTSYVEQRRVWLGRWNTRPDFGCVLLGLHGDADPRWNFSREVRRQIRVGHWHPSHRFLFHADSIGCTTWRLWSSYSNACTHWPSWGMIPKMIYLYHFTRNFKSGLTDWLINSFQGVTFPSANSMISKWVPTFERTTIGAFVLAGSHLACDTPSLRNVSNVSIFFV